VSLEANAQQTKDAIAAMESASPQTHGIADDDGFHCSAKA